MSKEVTNEQIAAGAAVKGDNGKPVGRNTAIEVFDAMVGADPAIANKVAEEGELSNESLLKMVCQHSGLRVSLDNNQLDGYLSFARQAIETDRASRQVANKAEVEVLLQARSPEGDPWQEVGGEDFFKAHANGYEVSVCVNSPRKNSIRLEVIPPATTGASTVLTDGRIEAVFKELGVAGEPMLNTYKFARAIEREVAAQAGQVAVPEDDAGPWQVLEMADQPDTDRLLDVVLTNGVMREGLVYSSIDWTQVADWRYSRTPSPAKESK